MSTETARMAPGRVDLTEHSVPLPGLPPALDGLRLVHLTDLHAGIFVRARHVGRAAALINHLEADVIALTGDFVSSHGMRFLRAASPEIATLQPRLAVFACLGNHDHWENAQGVTAVLQDAGVRVLVNQAKRLTDGLWIAGIDDLMSGEPDLERTVADVPDDAALLLLSHNPTVISHVADHPCLVLSGHTHGGQVALPDRGPFGTVPVPGIAPFIRAWEWSGVRRHGGRVEAICGGRYGAGWYEDGRATMYVNRGFGINQSWPIRVNCPAEIARFTLRSVPVTSSADRPPSPPSMDEARCLWQCRRSHLLALRRARVLVVAEMFKNHSYLCSTLCATVHVGDSRSTGQCRSHSSLFWVPGAQTRSGAPGSCQA